MKLASISPHSIALKNSALHSTASTSRDGCLVVVDDSQGLCASISAPDWPLEGPPTLRAAVENWNSVEPALRKIDAALRGNSGSAYSPSGKTIPLSEVEFLAPLPRAFALIDASTFLSHIRLVRQARGAAPPANFREVPLLYQALSDHLLGPHDDARLSDEAQGLDFEAEIAVILSDVPQGASALHAKQSVRLITLMNDLTLRNLIPSDLASGFGFFHSKPASSFAPFAITPDELGAAWRDGRVHLPVTCSLNKSVIGEVRAEEMHFSFFELISYAARTRSLSAGTILGSGTISNESPTMTPTGLSVACLAERRAREMIDTGSARTEFLRFGDEIRIEVSVGSRSVFGAINQRVVPMQPEPSKT